MIYIFEDYINFDDWDDEEEYIDNIKIGDYVVLKDGVTKVEESTTFHISDYSRIGDIDCDYKFITVHPDHYVLNGKVIKISHTNDGENVFKIDGFWPWFKSKYFRRK